MPERWLFICRAFSRLLRALALAGLACACSSQAIIATWSCSLPDAGGGDAAPSFALPWSTGFENGFCEYLAGGFCTEDERQIVESPVHSGRFAAAYTVTSSRNQSRCFREGVLPEQAVYGAWFYLPSVASADVASDWNLIHFQDYNASRQGWDNTFDILLVNEGGSLFLQAWDQIQGVHYEPSPKMPIPIGSWFHIEVLLKRAAGYSGRIAIYQDGTGIVDQPGLVTESNTRGQWYIGNYWASLNSAESTVYVDDVTATASR